jgi:hypothetical protein
MMDDRDDLPDDIPLADAVEQSQQVAPEPPAFEPVDVPIEANPSDWQEQLQEVAGEDEFDEYR